MTTRSRLIAAARSWTGTPYAHAMSEKDIGCDCIGLVRGVWREIIGPEPEEPEPYDANWRIAAGDEPLLSAMRRHFKELSAGAAGAGSVLLFRLARGLPVKHCAIQTGEGRMIHAYSGHAVTEGPCLPWWRTRLSHVFDFPGVDP